MVRRLTPSMRTTLSNATSITRRYNGKSNIKRYNNNSTIITDTLIQAIGVLGLTSTVTTFQIHNNTMLTNLGYLITAFSRWQTAKRNHESTVSTIRDYQRKLRSARRLHNTAMIKKYKKLIVRAQTTKRRRAGVLNTTWSDFLTKAQDAGDAFLNVWNSYEGTKTKLMLP